MDTHTFWTTVGLIVTALVIIAPLAHRSVGGPPHQRRWLHAAGALAALSFTIGAGLVAAAMTVPWLCLGMALALNDLRTVGVGELWRRPNAAALGTLATWVWLAAGATWLTTHRLGLAPLGFDRAVTLLTVAHFHVAGVGLTALLLTTYRRRPRTTMLVAIWLQQTGMLTVAAGLTFDDHLEVLGAAAITVGLALWAANVVGWTRNGLHGRPRALLTIAAIAWILPMALALGWALGPLLPEPVVTTFATMLRFHAALQTFGLVLCGLAGVVMTAPIGDAEGPATAPLTNTATEDHDDVAHHTHD
jgi:YndJ-like protein